MANLKKGLKRGLAALLAVCMVLTSFNVTAWADGTSGESAPNEETPAKFVLKYDANDFIGAAQEAINSGETFSAEAMEFAKSDYNKLFNDSETTIFEFYPEEREDDMVGEAAVSELGEEIAALDDVFSADVRMFLRVKNWNQEAEDEYVMTGEEEIIFLFINATEDKLTFQIDINGYITKEITVPGNTSSIGGFGNATGSNADTKVPNNKVDTNVPGKNDGAAVPAVPETAPAEQPTTEAVEPTETLPVESSEPESTEQAIESSEAANPAESTESSETTEASTEAEVESSTAASEESTTAAEETEAAATEAATEAETTEAATEAEVTEAATEAEVTEAAAEEPAATEEATEAEEPVADAEPQITMSLNRVPVVGSAPQDAEEEFTEEEETTTETVNGNLSGKTLGVTQIAEEEEVRSKAFVTTAGQIMGLMKAVSGEYTLKIRHELYVYNKYFKDLINKSYYYLYYETQEIKNITIPDTGYDYSKHIYDNYKIWVDQGENKAEDMVIRANEFKNGVATVTIKYLPNDEYVPKKALDYSTPGQSQQLGEFEGLFDKLDTDFVHVDEVYPWYISVKQGSTLYTHNHFPVYAGQCEENAYRSQEGPRTQHYILIKQFDGRHLDAIAFVRCDKYGQEEPEKIYREVKFSYENENGELKQISAISVLDKTAIKDRVPEYNIPTEANGETITKWIDVDSGKEYSFDEVYDEIITAPRHFKAVFSPAVEYNKVTFKAGEHGSFTNTKNPLVVEFDNIVSGTAWNHAGISEPEVTAETGYSFIGWKPALPQDNPAITEDLVFVAQYKENPNGQLVVRKQVDGPENSKTEKFSFKAEFKGANEELSYEGGTEVTKTDENGTVVFEFKLSDNETITFSNIAKDIEFVITELKFENDLYLSKCSAINLKTNDVNYTFNELDASVKGNLKNNIANEITFVNQVTVATGDITINKTISGKEDVNGAFIFEVENIMPEEYPGSGTRVYATVNVVNGIATPVTLTGMPAGNYRIKEISQLGYELSGFTVDGQSIAGENGYVFTVPNDDTKTVTVVAENGTVDTKYFTNSDLAVNQAVSSNGEIHFQRMEADGTKHKEPVTTAKVEMNAVIPNNKTSNFGDDGFDDGDTPLTNC